jgi:4-hydroxybutyryl-CoA dehydratase/vinylacetyl-CoA-Delta-isomerase
LKGSKFREETGGSRESFHGAANFFEVARLAVDLAGGFLATVSSQHDPKKEHGGHLVRKYFSGVEGIPPEDRIKIARLIEAMTGGPALMASLRAA